MKFIIKLLIILTFNLVLLTTLSASTLNLSMSSSPTRVNPILANDSASSEIADRIFNGLFTYDKNANIINELASSHEFLSKTRLRIKLKKNVFWHDGAKFSADDVIFTYNTILNPKVVSSYVSSYKEVKELKKIDDYTLEVIYKKPYFKALEIWMMGILPKHLLENEKDLMTSSFNKHPIGTGPYTLKGFKIGEDIYLHANKNYFKGEAKIEEIHYKFIPDSSTSFLFLKQKKLDYAGITPLQYDRQLNKEFKDNFKIIEKPSFSYDYLGFNLKNKKFQDLKVRQALSLAINRQELVDILFFKHGRVSNGPFLPGSSAYNSEVKEVVQDIKKAKSLLKEAGYDENNPFTFEVITSTGGQTRINAAQILQYQLKKVGINMKIRVMQWQAFLNTIVHPRNFEAIILGWSMSIMPDAYSIWHSSRAVTGGFNLTSYNNKEVDDLIELGSSTINKQKFAKIYKKIFKIISEDLPYLFLYIPNAITVINKNISPIEPTFVGIRHNELEWIKE